MRVLEESLAERRRKKILGALVSTYISTGEPVASSRVLARARLDLSPATVRSVMGQLDKLGLTVQPHTSAGRIPTQKGFKAFVESLVLDDAPAREFWPKAEKEYEVFAEEQTGIGGLLERFCALLSEASGEAGVVLSPGFLNSIIREIKLVEVGAGRILAVVISDIGVATTSAVIVGRKLGYFNLKRIEEYLNAKLRGPEFAGLFSESYLDEAEKAAGERLYSEVVLKYLISGGSGKRQLFLEGFSKIFEKKEMHDPEAACSVVRFFEDKTPLINLLESCQGKDGVAVFIGDEIQAKWEGPVDLAMVAAPYKVSGVSAGAIGVIGSMRMRYSRVIPLVEHGAGFLSKRFSEIYGRARIASDPSRPFKMALRPRRHWDTRADF